MAWPNLSGIIKVRMTYGFDGKPSVNVHFVLQRTPASPIPTAVLNSAAAAFYNAWSAQWDTRAHEDWSLDEVTATDWSMADGEEISHANGLPLLGLGAVGDPCPASVALVVSHRTGKIGRSRRGRNYIPGLAQAEVDGNDSSEGIITDLAAMYTNAEAGLAAASLDLVVYSLYSGGIARVTPIATLVTSHIINSAIDTQRRRLT